MRPIDPHEEFPVHARPLPRVLFTSIAAILAASAGTASAQEAATTSTVEDLEQRIRILERKLENADEEAATKAKSSVSASASDKGFGLKSADGSFDLKIRLLAQADGRFSLDPEPAFNDTFLMRRLRPPNQLQDWPISERLPGDFFVCTCAGSSTYRFRSLLCGKCGTGCSRCASGHLLPRGP